MLPRRPTGRLFVFRPAGPYRIFYRHDDRAVTVCRILHQHQNTDTYALIDLPSAGSQELSFTYLFLLICTKLVAEEIPGLCWGISA
ncbi:type II toxin-antitoxin system RelE/ParE family toxin [Adlercreutzia sp. R7]|uniref:Type II toxin-antitoxin system RelE/ParE family toxin n=1 Tax=Adlercreutzia wanghongyangiae TaxID=3111451 RepID=A0ABU6IIA7_9ACTN|nr:type II toxin-antitoxin system RelE/ParE family toxin [Adlercreutzia sp. R7]